MNTSAFTLQSLLPKSRNPFLLHAQPAPGFAFFSPDFGPAALGELTVVTRETASHRTRVVSVHPRTGLEFDVTYTRFPDTGAIEYAGRITNRGDAPLGGVKGPFSFHWCVDTERIGVPRLMTLSGGGPTDSAFPTPTFAPRRFDIAGSLTLRAGDKGISTQQDMPYLVVANPEETHGFAAALEWPAFWMIYCHTARMRINGADTTAAVFLMHLDKTNLVLRPGASLALPRATLVFFDGGLAAGVNRFRRHVATHVTPRVNGAAPVPPVFYNNYFGCGDRFTSSSLKPVVDRSAELGLEYFVIDAGWFEGGFLGGRGNWERPDRGKLPEGMDCFAKYVQAKGMKFGTWLETEFAMPGTDWAVRHPDWFRSCRATTDRLLKLEEPAVRDKLLDFIEPFLKQNRVEWLRWDFNNAPAPFWDEAESMDDRGWVQTGYGEGLFAVLDEMLRRAPGLHLEACAGGGHRMDLGTLRRAHSYWMSDDSASIPGIRSRLRGLNLYVPGNYGNTCLCHMRWGGDPGDANKLPPEALAGGYPSDMLRVRMAGSLGFSENLGILPGAAFTQVAEEIRRFKSVREFLMKDYHPLFEPRSLRDWDGWQFHDPESGKGFLMAFRSASPHAAAAVVPGGFESGVRYRLEDLDTGRQETVTGGRELPLTIEAPRTNLWLRYEPA